MACALTPSSIAEDDEGEEREMNDDENAGNFEIFEENLTDNSATPTTDTSTETVTCGDGTCSSGVFQKFPEIPPIHTKSIERTLIPLVQQITTLVNAKERNLCSDRTLRAIARVGQSVNVAVERFVTVGEAIADESDEIRPQMYSACLEARSSGSTIEKLCEYGGPHQNVGLNGIGDPTGQNIGHVPKAISDRAALIRTARCMLAAVTRVLILADSVVVKQLLLAKDKVVNTLTRLESVTNFTEFVKAFSHFGSEMVELAQLTGDRQADMKDERRRAQIQAARQVLERSTQILLTSSKTCLRHPDNPSARENRDTVFCQMRRAMDLIHYVVKDGVLDSANSLVSCPSTQPRRPKEDDWEGSRVSMSVSLQRFLDQVEVTRMTLVGPQSRTQLPATLELILERIQDFTDSAYTSHEHRENILLLCDRVRLQLNQLLRVGLQQRAEQQQIMKDNPNNELERYNLDSALDGTLKSVIELRTQLQETAILQGFDLLNTSKDSSELIDVIRNASLMADSERLEEVAEHFTLHIEHSQEVCKLLRNVSPTDSTRVQAKYAEINLSIYGPQLVVASRTLCSNPTSKIAKENLEVFVEMWTSLMDDIQCLTTETAEICRAQAGLESPDKQTYQSLPRPGKHGTTQKPLKPVKLDQEEQAKIAKSGLEMKMITSDLEAEAEKWGEENFSDENNEIVRRAKYLSNMAYNMYQFTRGEGPLKTTQDLFTQAEYYAEEANQIYKVIRQFSYTVPTSAEKKGLLERLDEVPTRVQQLQFTVKQPTVGKAATFTKVDSVIQETKNLMNVISKVVTTCFECASKVSVQKSATPKKSHQQLVHTTCK